jgi:hypothetical protein
MTGLPAKDKPRTRDGRFAFISLRETIQAEIEQGWPLTVIHEKYAGQLGMGYSQFTRYVAVHIRAKAAKSRNNTARAAAPSRSSGAR